MKKYRFFYHYNKINKRMTVHFKGKCHIVDNIICSTSCNSKWNKRQPNLVMQGFCKELIIDNGTATIK